MERLLYFASAYLTLEHLHNVYQKNKAVSSANGIPGKKLDIGATGSIYQADFMRPVLTGKRCDIVPAPGRDIEYCDLTQKMPYDDKEFEAVFCSHVLGLLEPGKVVDALGEIERIAKRAIIVIPAPWHSSFWLYPEHRSQIWKTDYGLLVKPHFLWGKGNVYRTRLDKKLFEIYQ